MSGHGAEKPEFYGDAIDIVRQILLPDKVVIFTSDFQKADT